MLFDAHAHLCHCPPLDFEFWSGIATFCTKDEWISFHQFHQKSEKMLKSFGVHPQFFLKYGQKDAEATLDFLRFLLEKDDIFAIGEIGFDFFTKEFKSTRTTQEDFWKRQLSLALQFEKPVILHVRKAMEMIFLNASTLKKLPAVVFHSFSGSKNDAKSILKHGVNAFFSFGKHQILNKKKASVDFLKHWNDFPNRILFETDAPYQTLKGETKTDPKEIKKVYEEASIIAGKDLEENAFESAKKLLLDCGKNDLEML